VTPGYESYYVRAVDPRRPRAVWLRHTVHEAPGHPAVGSIWVTLFDEDGTRATKRSVAGPVREPWLSVGDSSFGPEGVRGPGYDLRWTSGGEPPLRHLPAGWMYRAPLPKTKLETPLPAVRVSGTVTVDGTTVEADGWPGMVGHNWGTQHAERWIWLHGTSFAGDPQAWLDLAVARVKVGPVLTPWIANGVLSRGGERRVIRGRAVVDEDPLRLRLRAGGLTLTARSPREQTVVWRYADPDGREHHVANCSVAALEVAGLGTSHGGVYELGMRETTHGLPVQPFTDP
jgi:hypothetical protein